MTRSDTYIARLIHADRLEAHRTRDKNWELASQAHRAAAMRREAASSHVMAGFPGLNP
jgi:hypothetical protein